MRLTRTAVATLLLIALGVPACADPPERRLAVTGLAVGRDPALVVWVGAADDMWPHTASPHLVSALHAPLVATNPVTRLPAWGDAAPGALVQTLTSGDLRRWELTIKTGWQWHDGTPVTAQDLERGWRSAMAAGLPLARAVNDVRATDDHTLAFALHSPFGQVPHLLAHQTFLPLPPGGDDATSYGAAPIGTGPYAVDGRDGDQITLSAVADHPAASPDAADQIIVSTGEVPDVEVDVAVGADGDVAAPSGPGAAGRTRLVQLPGRQLAYLGMPLTEPAFADAAVRRALSLAIDRQELADALDGAVVPADRLLGPGFARAAQVSCPACRFDPERAADVWPDEAPTQLTLWYAADAGHEPVIRLIAERWRRILGVQDIRLASAPADDLIDRIASTDVDGPFRLTWQADVSAPVRLIEPLFGPRGSANDVRFRSEQLEDLLAAAGADRDLASSLQVYGQAEQLLLDELPVIPLWFSTIPVATRADITGVVLDGEGRLDWTQLRG